MNETARRIGDEIAMAGDYQYRALYEGLSPQRFWHHAILSEAERWISPKPGDLIVDVGCGSGLLAARLAECPGTRVIATDTNPEAISFGSRQFQRPNLEFRRGLVEELDFEGEEVTKISFLEVIEHIPSEQALHALSTFHRLLRNSGLLVISTPNAHSLWPVIEWLLDRIHLTPPMAVVQHVSMYSLSSLENLAERAGFRLVAYRTFNGMAPWLSIVSWKLALAVHRLERRRPHRLGSTLLAAFRKADATLR